MATEESTSTFAHFATQAIHVGQEPEQWKSMALVPPISNSTTYKQFAPAEHAGYYYSRSGNPTRNCVEKCIAALEGGKHGMCLASGLAATCIVTHLLSCGDHIISMDDLYGGTNRYFRKCAGKQGIETSFVDCTNIDNVKPALKPNTKNLHELIQCFENNKGDLKMVWIETPTNPTMKIVDIEAVSKVVKAANEKIMVVVDNTFMSSYFQRPLYHGADIVMHSLTKYMNGHSDVVMGALVTSDDKLAEELRFYQKAVGPVPSPFDCYLVNRGLKTLHLRMEAHQKNGLAVAKFLEANPAVIKVNHPGLLSHPQYELGKRLMKGYSGMLTFFIKGGLKEAKKFLGAVKVFTLAESLGGFESLCELPQHPVIQWSDGKLMTISRAFLAQGSNSCLVTSPPGDTVYTRRHDRALQTHASIPAEERIELGITDNLIRLSVGLEDIEDLIADIGQALKAAVPDSGQVESG